MTKPKAKSLYTGLRLTVTQQDPSRPCVVTLSTKQRESLWDDWNLLFPAIRVEVQPLNGYDDVLRAVVATVEALLSADRLYE